MGISADEVIDFSVGSNPFSFPPEIKGVLNSVAIDRYPDSECAELRACLSEKLGISPDNIIVGSGSTEIIRLIALAYFGHGDSVLILKPTFGEYEVACRIVGAKVWSSGQERKHILPSIPTRHVPLSRNINPRVSLSAIPTTLPGSICPNRRLKGFCRRALRA